MKKVRYVIYVITLCMIIFGCTGNNPNKPKPLEPTWELLNFTLIDDGTAYEVSSDSTHATHIVIPSEYNGLPVTRIGNDAFIEFRNLKSIYIPDSIIRIGVRAFYLCTSITSVSMPNSVTSIGTSAFSGCSGLTNIKLSSNLQNIGHGVFGACGKLTSI